MSGAAWLRPGQVCSEGGSPHSGTYLHRALCRGAAGGSPEPRVGSCPSQCCGGVGLGAVSSPSVSWCVTVGVWLQGRRAAAIPFPKAVLETTLCTSLRTHRALAAAQGEVQQDLQEREDQRSLGTGTSLWVVAGLLSRRQSCHSCQLLAQLEVNSWGSAPLREPARCAVNQSSEVCCSPAFRRRVPKPQPSAPTTRAFDTKQK